MFRSLHMKLVLILVLMIVSVMAVMGTFLINSVSTFYLDSFYEQMQSVFNQPDLMDSLREAAAEPGTAGLRTVVDSHASALGLDDYRNYSILDGQGRYLDGSNPNIMVTRTSNIVAAMAGGTGTRSAMSDSVMDIAIPIDKDGSGSVDYIIYVADDKQEISDLSWRFFQIVMQTMMFGLLAAILLSFLLSKTITDPIERITEGARTIAAGDFDPQLGVQSSDEIGELTRSFNYMAGQLRNTVGELQSERDKLNTMFLHMTDGVAAFSTEGRLLHMNPATENLLGVHMSGRSTFDELFADLDMPDSDETAMRSFLTSEITRFGRVLSVTLAPYGVLDGEGGVIAVIHDITEQRRLDDARREFVANVSHELRTPLTNIRSYTETLLDAAGDIPLDTQQQFLNVISSESERMARIVTDLLTLSKLDHGRMELRMTRFALGATLRKVVDAMQLTAADGGLALVVEVPDDLPAIVGDRERIEQVVVNILSNAVKYTPPGGHIRLAAGAIAGRRVRITVEDDGVGIPAADVPRLFERFYRVDKARSRAAGGTGLGLAIAKQIV
ncbi:MAG: ATP-binding protein, partial [Eubacteriales bacterium]|nr:ATP-binding protein [Eubacteriales bacterium]